MRRRQRWDLIGIAAGLALGVFDYFFFTSLGLEMTIGGVEVTLWVCLFFSLTYALFGLLISRLVIARARARADATTIERQYEALQATQRQVVQNEKLAALGRIAAGMAHELRNPLGVIRASAAMVGEGFEPGEDSRRACDFILEEIDRLNALITALLSFSRPAEPRMQVVRLEEVALRAMQLAQPELSRRAIQIEVRAEPDALQAEADPDLISQVLLGLLVNAAEALEQGGRIEVRLQVGAKDICIEIADSGPGLQPNELERVFEPFYTSKPQGTGLGLPMAARILQVHGGSIEALDGCGAGPGGAGACFRLRLPGDRMRRLVGDAA